MLPAISRRGATCQLVVVERSGAKLVPNVAGPPRTILASRHAEGSSVCSVECLWSPRLHTFRTRPARFSLRHQVLVTVRLRSAAGAGSLGLARFTIKTRLSIQASSRSCPRRPGASGESAGRRGGLFGLSAWIRCTLARRVMTHE